MLPLLCRSWEWIWRIGVPARGRRRPRRVVEPHRLTRGQFERWVANRAGVWWAMGSRGSAYHWARVADGLGIEVRLLPAADIRVHVKRNKTDAADAGALLEADAAPK